MEIRGEDFLGGEEYLVFEKAEDDTEWWYRHGSIHHSFESGVKDLLYKRKIYEKYGRKFKLMKRTVSEWIEDKAKFDPSGNQERPCENCGHAYRRHFDWMENDEHVGCKYCPCDEFKEENDGL